MREYWRSFRLLAWEQSKLALALYSGALGALVGLVLAAQGLVTQVPAWIFVPIFAFFVMLAPLIPFHQMRMRLVNTELELPHLELGDPEFSTKIVDQTPAQHWTIRLRNTIPNTSAHGVSVDLSTQPTLASTSVPLPLPKIHSSRPIPLSHDVPYGADVTFDVVSYDDASRIFYLWRADHIEDQLGPCYMVYKDSVINDDPEILDAAVDGGGMMFSIRTVSADGRSAAYRTYRLVRDGNGDCSLTALQ